MVMSSSITHSYLIQVSSSSQRYHIIIVIIIIILSSSPPQHHHHYHYPPYPYPHHYPHPPFYHKPFLWQVERWSHHLQWPTSPQPRWPGLLLGNRPGNQPPTRIQIWNRNWETPSPSWRSPEPPHQPPANRNKQNKNKQPEQNKKTSQPHLSHLISL